MGLAAGQGGIDPFAIAGVAILLLRLIKPVSCVDATVPPNSPEFEKAFLT
jgi:hypothetical protein